MRPQSCRQCHTPKYFPELSDKRASPSASRSPRAQANVAASESAPEGADDLIFPNNQEDVEQTEEYTDDDYIAMMVAQGHFDTGVEEFSTSSSTLDDAEDK